MVENIIGTIIEGIINIKEGTGIFFMAMGLILLLPLILFIGIFRFLKEYWEYNI